MCHYACETCTTGASTGCKVCASGFLRNGADCVSKCDDS